MSSPAHVEVKLRENESVERLIRRFIKKVKKEKVLEIYNERRYYKKPSLIRREKEKKRLQVIRKLQRDEELKQEKGSSYRKQ